MKKHCEHLIVASALMLRDSYQQVGSACSNCMQKMKISINMRKRTFFPFTFQTLYLDKWNTFFFLCGKKFIQV